MAVVHSHVFKFELEALPDSTEQAQAVLEVDLGRGLDGDRDYDALLDAHPGVDTDYAGGLALEVQVGGDFGVVELGYAGG